MQSKPVLFDSMSSWWIPNSSSCIHISEGAVTLVELKKENNILVLGRHHKVFLDPSKMDDLRLINSEALLPALMHLRQKTGVRKVRVVLPSISTGRISGNQMDKSEIATYKTLLKKAGFSVKYAETEDAALMRVLPVGESGTASLAIRISDNASYLALIYGGKVVRVGRNLLGMNALATTPASQFPMLSSIGNDADALYLSWAKDMHALRGTAPRAGQVLLYGAVSNIAGADEFFSSHLRTPAQNTNVWANVLSFDHSIPDIKESDSRDYAEAIGGALGAYRK